MGGNPRGMDEHVEWHVGHDSRIPPEVADAAARGVPIFAVVEPGAAIDGHAAELLEECASVVRRGGGDYAGYVSKLSGVMSGLSPSV